MSAMLDAISEYSRNCQVASGSCWRIHWNILGELNAPGIANTHVMMYLPWQYQLNGKYAIQ
jgi:hypothetical protein